MEAINYMIEDKQDVDSRGKISSSDLIVKIKERIPGRYS